jgi:hypothetical protein
MDNRQEDIAFFSDRRTSLADITKAGWHTWSGTAGWYGYEKPGPDGAPIRFSVALWIKETVADAYVRGSKDARQIIRDALASIDIEQ